MDASQVPRTRWTGSSGSPIQAGTQTRSSGPRAPSWPVGVVSTSGESRASFPRPANHSVVRVIDYVIDDGRGDLEPCRLMTTVLHPGLASAEALALVYAERWEIESAFDELKTHQRGPRTVLGSKPAELVNQVIWGHLCCHFAIRTLTWEAAAHADEDPDRVSFVAALRIARRSVAQRAAFPLSGHQRHLRHLASGHRPPFQRLNPMRRRRSNPHVIKRKMPKWHVKRSWHADWIQPTGPPTATIRSPPNER
jgi:hypothetical protein